MVILYIYIYNLKQYLSISHHHTLSTDTNVSQTIVHASQSQQPTQPDRVPRQPQRQTKDDHMTTDIPSTNQSARHHATPNIITRYHHGV